ncbi:hypothetical protein [Nitrosomonas sp.]|uniref:hypothetical protein n=1 Tax=Nitrosomonas sp. TaxID=42353 RepID=UPI0025F8DFEC|nr:hypothetical protein [Nitrosomonas sp.]
MSALGSLVVKLALEHAEYTQGLDKSSQEALKFGKNIQGSFDKAGRSAKEFFSGIAAGAVAGIASIVGINAAVSKTRDSINILASINDAAEKTGSSIEDLSRIEQVSRNYGDSFVEIDKALGRISKGLAEFKDPANDAVRALDAIGVSTHDSNGELRKAADVYIDVARSLQQYEDGAQKTAVANALFGKSGTDLIPAMNNLASGIDSVRSVSGKTTLAADDFKDAMARTGAIVDSLFFSMAGNLLPTLNNIITAVNSSATQMDGFAASGNVVSTVLKGMVIAGYTIIDVFQGVGREIGGRAAQLVALSKLDFKAAGFIGDEIAKDSANARAEFDKFIDTVLNGDQKLVDSATSGGMKKTIDFAMRSSEEIASLKSATDSSANASQNFMQKLESEAAQLGKTSVEIRKMEAAKLGLSSVADPLIDKIEQETAAARRLEAQLTRVKSITESVQTADERFSQTVDELNDLMAIPNSGLSIETYSRAVKKAQSELDKSINATKDSGRQAANEWSDIWRNAENTARNAFVQFAAHGKSAMESIGESIKFFIFDALYQLTVRKWIVNVGAAVGLGGIGGSGSALAAEGGSGILNAASLGSNALGLFKSGFGVTGLLSKAGSMLPGSAGSFFSGMGVTGTQAAAQAGASALWGSSGASAAASMGTSFAAVAGPAIALAAVDAIGRVLAGDKKLGGAEMIPVVGGFLAALFGRGPYKFRQQSIQGTASSEGFDGDITNVFRAKGGLFRSNGHKSQTEQFTLEQQTLFDSALNGFYGSAHQFAENLGLSTDLVDNFTQEVQIKSEKGKTVTEEAINEMLQGIGNSLAQNVLPIVDTFRKAGEDSFATLTRLNTEFVSLSQAAQNLGASVDYAKQLIGSLSIEARTAFLDNYGGTEKLLSDSASFSQLFLTEAERMAPAIKFVEDGLTSLGFSANITKDEFKQLVQTLLQSASESDQAKGVLLLQNNALFASVADYKNSIQEVASKTEGLTAKTEDLTEAQQDYIDSVNRTIRAMQLDSAANQIALINQEIDKLIGFADSLKNTVEQISPQSLDSARQQVIEATQAARGGKVTDISAALATLSNQSTSGFTDSFSFARSKAQSIALIDQLSEAISGAIEFKQASIADDLRIAANRSRIPAFASGGHHRGGLRIVGERGPEIERTGPSHITSNSDLKKSIGNDELLQELKKMNSTLDSVTQSGTALRTRNVA